MNSLITERAFQIYLAVIPTGWKDVTEDDDTPDDPDLPAIFSRCFEIAIAFEEYRKQHFPE